MAESTFATLATIPLPSQSRLLASACCPDKDLVILISRLGGLDRLSLWKIQGGKKWEVDVNTADSANAHIVDVCWSPDGQSIAVAHDPPAITVHSVQDGREERHLSLLSGGPAYRLTGIWWFITDNTRPPSSIPDIFRRGDIITGTSHSLLKVLPLLDSLPDDTQRSVATDIFAFQGSQTRKSRKSTLPDVIRHWPTLKTDFAAASMSDPNKDQPKEPQQDAIKQAEEVNKNSMLTVADTFCRFHTFLDGTFSLGHIGINSTGANATVYSLCKNPKEPTFLAHPRLGTGLTDLLPTRISLPLLKQRHVRDLARLSSSSRELIWYIMRCVKDMRAAWFGSDTLPGARELGPKWIQALEAKQKELFGQEEPNPMLDLTTLLATGRASESLSDFLGSGELMSDRGIQKWDATVSEALIKLRDYSEKRVAPACQRFHLILEDLHGWSLLPHYSLFEIQPEEAKACLALASRCVVLSTWLAAVARREIGRFREFMNWIRMESVNANPNETTSPNLRYDILEVNKYLTGGLVVSSIDKWFMGPVPQYTPQDLGISASKHKTLAEAIKEAKNVAENPSAQPVWQQNVRPRDLSHLDRNLDALVQELTTRCGRMFDHASHAAARSAEISPGEGALSHSVETPVNTIVHERVLGEGEDSIQYFTSILPRVVCVLRQGHGHQARQPVEVAVLEGCLEGNINLELLSIDFFDDECIVLVYRTPSVNNTAHLSSVDYRNLSYQEISTDAYSIEGIMMQATSDWASGKLGAGPIPIKQSRQLNGFRTGEVSLSVNGRAGRRVACVLDWKGTMMETLDLEAEPEDEGDGEMDESV